jgi:isoquinoline 1-oxidoreductase beta subunit
VGTLDAIEAVEPARWRCQGACREVAAVDRWELIRAQVEGGILFGVSAAAWGEIVLGAGGDMVTQNFDRYRIERMQSIPAIEVHLIDSDDPPTGVGEVSVPTTALANAIPALTGTRIRRLPLSKSIRIY